MKRTVLFILSICLAGTLLVTGCSTGKDGDGKNQYPSRAIDLVVPVAAGSGTDVMARITAKFLAQELGQPVNVVNKPGGNAVAGVLSVMSAQPDGYTLLADANMWSSFQVNAADLPYKVENRTFVAKVSGAPIVLFCSGKAPWQNVGDAVKAAQADPSGIAWGGLGGMSSTDLGLMQFFNAAKIDVAQTKKVIYQGGGQVLAAAAGGHIQIGGAGASGILPFVQGGKLRPLFITGDKRLSMLPDVMTAQEAGYPDVTSTSWLGISGPPAMSPEIVKRLDEALKKVTAKKEFIEEMNKVAAIVKYVGPEDMKKEVLAEADKAKSFLK
jgi:Uncharacterized protein conserved in bacteria